MNNINSIPTEAIVIGATGLIGKALVQQLLEHDSFTSVIIFVRRSSGISHPKLKEFIIDFNEPAAWENLVRGHVVFSAMGTTIGQAGSQKAQYLIDYTYQYRFAQAAAKNGVMKYSLVSSVGAKESSRLFYTRMKGQLENNVQKLSFRQTDIFRPSILEGVRKQPRPLEVVGAAAVKIFNKLGVFTQYKPVKGFIVAQKMIQASLENNPGSHIWMPEQITSA